MRREVGGGYTVGRYGAGAAVLCLFALLCAGCRDVAKNAPANVLHVTSVTPDGTPGVTGILNGKEYALTVDRKGVPLYVAYYEPIDVADVSKDFPAQFEESSNELIVQVPNRGAVRYAIRFVREKD